MVQVVFFEQSIGCETCGATRRALEQIVRELDADAALETFNLVLDKDKAESYQIDRVPAIIITAPGGNQIRYYGAPLGGERPTLIEALRMAKTGESRLSDESRSRLRALDRPVQIKVFFTPSCVYCPQMVSLANRAAIESPLVTTTAIDATEFPDLVRRYNVNGVPKTVIDDATEIVGAVSEEEFIAAIS
jgi:glutaredoxin-like protein